MPVSNSRNKTVRGAAMKVLFDKEVIRQRIGFVGKEIAQRFKGEDLTLIILANGGIFFGVDLARAVDIPHWIDVIGVTSYTDDKKCRYPQFRCPPKLPVAGRHVVLVDDVADSGETLECCEKYFLEQGAKSVASAVLMDKDVPGRSFKATWKCFEAPNEYLIGYGLDSCEFFRSLDCVAVFDKE